MKKIIPSILIAIIALQLFAPFSVGLENKKVVMEKKIADASDSDITGIIFDAEFQVSDTNITVYAVPIFKDDSWINTVDKQVVAFLLDSSGKILPLINNEKEKVNYLEMAEHKIGASGSEASIAEMVPVFQKKPISKSSSKDGDYMYKRVFTGLTPNTAYKVVVLAAQNYKGWLTAAKNTGRIFATGLFFNQFYDDDSIWKIEGPTTTKIQTTFDVKTRARGETENISAGSVTVMNETAILPTCDGLSTLKGCIGQILYYLIFVPSSALFEGTGRLLDKAVDYSTRSESYTSEFVTSGWGIVRDFCNMFFIFVLLYIAIGTILNLHSVKTKEMIINVVIIGLLMNFSLFATQVIIDASNILTRVFYNTSSIKVGPTVDGVIQNEVGSNGEIKLSEAIVSKINPQKLILESAKIGMIQPKGIVQEDKDTETKTNGDVVSAGTFMLIVVLASIVNIIGLITFLTCGLLFVVRVIGLWLAMILVPMAFFSYTVPALQDLDTVGWKKWWPNTLKLAFMGPVFVFFLYIIIKFLDSGLGIVTSDTATGMNFALGIMIPFIFIMILLMKAKDITIKMSGELGQSIIKAASSVGGMALGGAIGLAAGGVGMLGRSTIGKFANNALSNEKLQAKASEKGLGGAMARMQLKSASALSKNSFDARGVKVMGKGLGDLKLNGAPVGVGKQKEGGYKKDQENTIRKKQEMAKMLELGPDSHQVHDLHSKQEALEKFKNENAGEIEKTDKDIELKRSIANEKAQKVNTFAEEDPRKESAREEAQTAQEELEKAQSKKKEIMSKPMNIKADQGHVDDALKDEEKEVEKLTAAEEKLTAAEEKAESIKANKPRIEKEAEDTRKDEDAKIDEEEKNSRISTISGYKNDPAREKEFTDRRKASEDKERETKEKVKSELINAEYEVETAEGEVMSARENKDKATAKTNTIKNAVATGGTIERTAAQVQSVDITRAQHNISKHNSEVKNKYADTVKGQWWIDKSTRNHASHDIIMNAKIESKGGGHGSGGGHSAPAAHAPAPKAEAKPASGGGGSHGGGGGGHH